MCICDGFVMCYAACPVTDIEPVKVKAKGIYFAALLGPMYHVERHINFEPGNVDVLPKASLSAVEFS